MPLVSVVIPTYNRARDLDRALRSVLAQTFADFEVIVVDQYSTDDTDAVVAALDDRRITLHKIHNDRIVARSRNFGMAQATGEFVAFLDSDDWWLPNKLEVSLAPLRAGADVTYHDLFLATSADQQRFRRRVRARPLNHPAIEDLLVNGNAIPLSSAVARRTVLLASGGQPIEPEFVAMEDYGGWLRVAAHTERFVRLNETLGYYWAGGGNISNDDRTLRLLELFLDEYRPTLVRQTRDGIPWWVTYTRARIYHRRGLRADARDELSRLSFRDLPRDVVFKALFLRFFPRFAP